MAIDGQSFRSFNAAIASIDQVLGAASTQVSQAGMGGPQSLVAARFPAELQLARVDDAVFRSAARGAFADLAWFDDKWCSGRSFFTSQLLADSARRPLAAGLLGFGPMADAVAGAVGIVDGPFQFAGGMWSYHAVGVGWPRSSSVPMAIDGALFPYPVPLDRWARRIGAELEDVHLCHPWDVRGLAMGDSLDRILPSMRHALVGSVRSVGETVRIDNPLLRGAPIDRLTRAGPDDAGRGAAYARGVELHERR